MAYQLPSEIDERVRSQIALGYYQSPAEVLTDALDALDARHSDLEDIRAGIEDEKASRMRSLDDVEHDMRLRYGLSQSKGSCPLPLANENAQFPIELRQLNCGSGRKTTHRIIFAIRSAHVVVYAIRHVAQLDWEPDTL